MFGKLTLGAGTSAAILALAVFAGFAGHDAQAGVTSLTLTPPTATNLVGTDHTVTATTTNWPTGEVIDFDVTAGPNTGATVTCAPNPDCSTDGSGVANATYTSDGAAGTDTIQACTTELQPAALGEFIPTCDTATKEWGEPSPTPTVGPTPTPTVDPDSLADTAEELPQLGAGSDDGGSGWFLAGLVALGGVGVVAGAMLLRKRPR
jgi:hypothetical protein